jgi:hypothetical protein
MLYCTQVWCCGGLDWDHVLPLNTVVEDPSRGRRGDHAITLFKALGVGLSDVALGVELLAPSGRAGLGDELALRNGRHVVARSGGIPRDSPRRLLLDEAHHVALGVREERERDSARNLRGRLHRLATRSFDLLERRLRVVHPDLEGDVSRALRPDRG